MTSREKEILKKYNIDLSKAKDVNIELSDEILESGKALAEIFIPVIANLDFSNFKDYLENGEYEKVYSSPVFKTIVSLCNEENITVLRQNTTVLRARIVKDMDDIFCGKNGIHFENGVLRGYDWFNSKEPPVGISAEGRANSRYSSYFYCADNGQTAASEIKANIGDYISLASFDIKRDLRLIRLEENKLPQIRAKEEWYLNSIARHFSAPVSDSHEYHLTQFISDEIRKHGVDGICYKSHFTNDYNYVIFNCSMSTITFKNSKIIQLYSQQLNYIDFSAEKMLSTHPLTDLNEQEIQREKHYIYGMMQAYKDTMSSEEDCESKEEESYVQTKNAQL